MNLNKKPFLKCKWTDLVIFNYQCDPELLSTYLPYDTELDTFSGKAYFSFVAFRFSDPKMFGIKIPFQKTFAELNLRFYVRDKSDRKGVVFIQEAVPNRIVAWTGKHIYGEPFVRMSLSAKRSHTDTATDIEYRILNKNKSISLTASGNNEARLPQMGSEEEFIIERYYAYCSTSNQATKVYKVEHRPWKILPLNNFAVDSELHQIVPFAFSEIVKKGPTSVCFADGSSVNVSYLEEFKTNLRQSPSFESHHLVESYQ